MACDRACSLKQTRSPKQMPEKRQAQIDARYVYFFVVPACLSIVKVGEDTTDLQELSKTANTFWEPTLE